MSEVTILTSGFKPAEYIDQYCQCIKKWNSPGPVKLLFAVAYPEYNKEEAEIVKRKLDIVCNEINLDVKYVESEGENYPQTINRMIKNHVDTEYVGILNLDDYRNINGIHLQMKTLDSGYDLTYGDFVVVNNMEIITNQSPGTPYYTDTYDFSDDEFNSNRRGYQQVFKWGPFLMWRKEIHDKIGYYDESLTVAADFDWVNRIIGSGHKVMKTKGEIIGAFLAVGKGLSTVPDTLGHRDNAHVIKRYFYGGNEGVINFGRVYNHADLINKAWHQ